MRCHARGEASEFDRALPSDLDRLHRQALPFDRMRGEDALIAPAAQMGEEAVGTGRSGLALVRLALAFGEPIEPATIKIDEAAVGADMYRSGEDGARSRAVAIKIKRARWRNGRLSVLIFWPLLRPR